MSFENHIEDIEKTVGYVFRDKSLIKQAFTRASYCNEANRREKYSYQSNEVLEFFGDSILSATIVTSLIKTKAKRISSVTLKALDESYGIIVYGVFI